MTDALVIYGLAMFVIGIGIGWGLRKMKDEK